METIKKQDGFKEEKSVILPGSFINEVSSHPLIKPIYFTDIGFFPNAKYHYRHRPNGCNQHILIYCIKGEGFYQINGRKVNINKDTFFLIPKDTPHCYGSSENNPWTIYWLHFSGTNSKNYFLHLNEETSAFSVSIEKLPKIKHLFDDILNYFDKGYTLDSMIYVSQVLANLLGVIFFMNHDYKLGLKEDNIRVEESIHFMTQYIDSSLTLKMLADQANLSLTHYSYLFKKKTGFSPINYFIRLKIQKSCRYLDTTDLKICDIARKLGFQDPYYFSRTFHKIMQQSPSFYRDIKKG